MVDDGRWHSPFAHGEGSSWHSADSLLLLSIFCYSDYALAAVIAAYVFYATRSRALCGAALLGLYSGVLLLRYSEVVLLETLVGRPWIWLIMT